MTSNLNQTAEVRFLGERKFSLKSCYVIRKNSKKCFGQGISYAMCWNKCLFPLFLYLPVFPKLTLPFCILTHDPNSPIIQGIKCFWPAASKYHPRIMSFFVLFSLVPVLTLSGPHTSSQVLCCPPSQSLTWLFPLPSLSFLGQILTIHLGISKSSPPRKTFSKLPS